MAAAGARAAGRLPSVDGGGLRFTDDAAPIEASLYSLRSSFFSHAEAAGFLVAVRDAARDRRLVVVCDPSMCDALRVLVPSLRLDLVPSGIPFTPWPRDPVAFARSESGDPVLLNRPNTQAGREDDRLIAEVLASSLSRILPGWRTARVETAPIPFHGGQMLSLGGTLWISLHSVEPRALALAGLDRVPVAAFASPDGLGEYAQVVAAAARELGRMFGRRVEFVHPMPASPDDPANPGLARRLAGGAGIDLDSYLTLVPGPQGVPLALVGDPRLGDELLASASAADLAALRGTYDLEPAGEDLRNRLRAAQAGSPALALAEYLDLVATHLSARGLSVSRLPLARVPTALLADRVGVTHDDFLLTWNNVVLSPGAAGICAEGFASGWPSADQAALRTFRDARVSLTLLPPLVHSIVLNGGYRCVSNHVRRPR